MNNIEFDEKTHIYKVNGKELPSVTTITGILSSIEYKDIDKAILERAAKKGSAVHKAIEDYTNWNDYELEIEYEPFMQQFLKALEKEKFELIRAEFKLTDGEICGTIDNMSQLGDKRIIIDYKTTSTIHKKLLEAQFGGYKRLCEANHINIDEWYGLFLTKKGYKFLKIEPNVEIFNKCKEIYDYYKGD